MSAPVYPDVIAPRLAAGPIDADVRVPGSCLLGGKEKLHSMDVRSVSSRSGLMGRNGSSKDPATGKDAHAEVNLTQRERKAGMDDGPRAVAATTSSIR